MPWGVAAGAAITAAGSYMAAESEKDAANARAQGLRDMSADQYAKAQAAAAKVPEFKPVTVTSSFGTPTYTYDSSGRLTGVSSTAAPWLQNLQTQGQNLTGRYMSLQQQALENPAGYNASNQAFNAAQGLYGRAAEAMPTSYDTTQATQDYYTQMKNLVAADQERQLAATRNNLFQRGRQGLAVGATQAGGELATNPEMAAYYNALNKSDAALALDAKSRAISDLQARQNMALGLFTAGGQQTATGGTALNQYYGNVNAAMTPFNTSMAQQTSMENMQYSPVTRGMQYGGDVTNQANQIANAYIRAAGAGADYQSQALGAQYNADANNPWAGLVMGAGQAIGGANWGSIFSGNNSGQGTGWATNSRTGPVNPATDTGMGSFYG